MPASPPLMMGVPASMPNTPMLVIVIVPPCWSAGVALPSRAVVVSFCSARASSRIERSCASLMLGTSSPRGVAAAIPRRSEEHTSELQSLMRISYAVFCLKKNNNHIHTREDYYHKHVQHRRR